MTRNVFIYTELFKIMMDAKILFHTPSFKFGIINLNSSDGVDISTKFLSSV